MGHSETILATALQLLTSIIVLATHLAVLIVAVNLVRPRRPEAGTWIAAGAGMMLFGDVVFWLAWRVVGYLGAGLVMRSFAAIGVLSALWGAAAWAVLLLGIVQLSKPPPARAGV